MDASQIGKRAWSYAGVLQDAGLSCFEYVEQLTLLLFLKMDDQQTEPPYNRQPLVPPELGWKTLLPLEGAWLEEKYREILEKLSLKQGMLGVIFKSARCEINNPALLKQLILNLIDKVDWLSLPVDVKGTIYEELLQRSAAESSRGAGQYFTPRPVIQTMCEVVQPRPQDRICDPAAGTGGFLCNAYQYVLNRYERDLDRDQKRKLREDLVEGMELSPKVGRMCAMNLYLHGIGGAVSPVSPRDSLLADTGETFDLVLTNPPFGKRQSFSTVNEAGAIERERQDYVREDFTVTTSNKQLNFLQHIMKILKPGGTAAVVMPDNVLFEGGAGETLRRRLLHAFRFHTLLRLPTGIFYKQGVKANVLFFEKVAGGERIATDALWVYDLRTNQRFTLRERPLKRADLDDFVACYRSRRRDRREDSERFRRFGYEELAKRDKLNLDISWLKDDGHVDPDSLPPPDEVAAEIVENLELALEKFRSVAARLGGVERAV